MPPSPWIPFATLTAAVIAAGTALLVGGLLTTRSRLQRRLEKDVAIWDKMPVGRVKDALEVRITRDAAELVVRTDGDYDLRVRQVGAAISFGGAAFSTGQIAFSMAGADPSVFGNVASAVSTTICVTTGFILWRSGRAIARTLTQDQLAATDQTPASSST